MKLGRFSLGHAVEADLTKTVSESLTCPPLEEMKTTPLCAASGFWVPYPRWSGSSTSKVDISKHLGLFGNTGCW